MYTSTSVYISHPVTVKRGVVARLKAIGLIGAALLSLGFSSKAGTYTAANGGKFNEETSWKPSYPGNVISANDTVVISSNIKLNVDVIIKGTMVVRSTGTLTGEKSLIVLDRGIFYNNGTTVIEALTNRGYVFNKHILETAKDMINTGKITNDESMVAGNILDNTGIITGNGGQLIANTKLMNSKTGTIVGNIDVCSNNFMNVDGGRLDSALVSFCGHRIFNSVFLTANLKKESVVLNLLNSQNKRFKEYTIEKSVDGKTFVALSTVKGSDIQDITAPFKYTDNELATSNTLYYRIKLIDDDGTVKTIPAVEVGNIQASRMSAMGK